MDDGADGSVCPFSSIQAHNNISDRAAIITGMKPYIFLNIITLFHNTFIPLETEPTMSLIIAPSIFTHLSRITYYAFYSLLV